MTDTRLNRENIELEKKKLRSKVMLFGGIGCMVFIIFLMALIYIFIDRITDLLG